MINISSGLIYSEIGACARLNISIDRIVHIISTAWHALLEIIVRANDSKGYIKQEKDLFFIMT